MDILCTFFFLLCFWSLPFTNCGCSSEGLMLKLKTPLLWPPHSKSGLIGEDPDAWRDWGHEEKGTTEDEMPGWHHRLDGHEFE